ncbi:MAG: response regulator transcription factor [Halodesulfurarchaeum sp.]
MDDEPEVRQLLRYYLEEEAEDFTVNEAPNGREAIAHIRGDSRHPDVVLLDLSMPEMGGFETLKRISALDRYGPPSC